jgi:hypothetical protein
MFALIGITQRDDKIAKRVIPGRVLRSSARGRESISRASARQKRLRPSARYRRLAADDTVCLLPVAGLRQR